ncbi:hypothetical protein [Candidatus Cytomitobacter primus]|uniref:Uncharacterized protein n=1 Tax=Candidatus Cytomitobacter primus TaxID=2066024 RepID=A0A5C0UF55_9PROT|nr:hypothetical protein [Candidatus Cytomitobacter primus]QEK38347.1 hypothetical protein FZC34_00185 [Candidatus Cytomitobacter primus]
MKLEKLRREMQDIKLAKFELTVSAQKLEENMGTFASLRRLIAVAYEKKAEGSLDDADYYEIVSAVLKIHEQTKEALSYNMMRADEIIEMARRSIL